MATAAKKSDTYADDVRCVLLLLLLLPPLRYGNW
jgi:hypothetical protein